MVTNGHLSSDKLKISQRINFTTGHESESDLTLCIKTDEPLIFSS